MLVRNMKYIHWKLVLVLLFFVSVLNAQEPQAISTFESIGLYWSPANGSSENDVLIKFKEAGSEEWHKGLPIKYNPIDTIDLDLADYRGSIVKLKPATEYEIKFSLEGSNVKKTIRAKTWSEDFPIGKIIKPENGNTELNLTASGTSEAYVLIDGTGISIDVNNENDYCINITGNYIIIRGFQLSGGRKGLIKLNDCHDIIIEDCDMTRWGEVTKYGYGVDYQAAIYSVTNSLERVIIQRNKIHHPRYGSNSWAEPYSDNGSNHPTGPQGISFENSAGNHVIRYNEIWSDNDHKYNDILGYGSNFSYRGFPGPDSDIYGNYLAFSYDDAIESEGGNRNVRIWDNYIENAYMAIANVATSIGPLYIWGNVSGKSYSPPGSSYGEYAMFLKMGENGDWIKGLVYVFNNTLLNLNEDGFGGIGTSEGEPVRGLRNLTTRNNILWVREKGHSISPGLDQGNNDIDFDLCSGKYPLAYEKNGIVGKPVFIKNSGFDFMNKTGSFQLAPSSPGVDAGIIIPNFNETYAGDAPDIGAFEAGQVPKEYGVNAYLKQ